MGLLDRAGAKKNSINADTGAALQSTAPKSAVRQGVARQSVAPKSAARQSAVPKSAALQSAAPKSAVRQSAALQSAIPKSAVRQSVVPKSAALQSDTPKSAALQSAVRQSAAPKSAALQSAAPKNTVRQSAASQSVPAIIVEFHRKSPLFHCIVLQANSGDISALMAGHGAVCIALPGGKCLVLLPGGLDAELFAHRLSQSTGSTILFQTSAHEPSLAFSKLRPYLR